VADAIPRELENYKTENGKEPFADWMETLKGTQTFKRVLKRLDRVEDGNLGDHPSVGDGVFELRFFDPGGTRVYYGEDNQGGKHLIILLTGGDKDSQPSDIDKAKEFWGDYNA
jgi:putative addiction module killer protein